jgi:hypothetical protein
VIFIRGGEIDLDDILEGLPLERASFPLKYPGLPLSVWWFRIPNTLKTKWPVKP